MGEDPRIERAARFLFEQGRARAVAPVIPEADRPRTEAEAYAVQEALQDLLAADGRGAIAGLKIGLTSPAIREIMAFDQPCGGAILANTIHASPATVASGDFVRLGLESEIAVRLGADLPADGAPYDAEGVAGAVQACAVAIELIEDRDTDYTTFTALPLIADNSWNAGIVLGPEVAGLRALDLDDMRVVLVVNGVELGEGRGRDALGHPFNGVAWLANLAVERGRSLRRGMVLMTGSVVATHFAAPGDEARVIAEGLGEARLNVT